MRIFHLIPRLDYSGAPKQLALLAPRLVRQGFDVHVGVLGNHPNPHTTALRESGAAVHVLGKGGRFDPLCPWNLRRELRSLRPDVIHVWGTAALRCLALSMGKPAVPVVAVRVLSSAPPGFLQRWLLRQPIRIIARGHTEAGRYVQAGVALERVALVPPAVAADVMTLSAEEPHPRENGSVLPEKFILCAGAMEHDKGFRDAVWAFDILKFLFEDFKLLLAGDGPERRSLERFSRSIQLDDYVQFLGPRNDIEHLLRRAALVWVPSVADCGAALAAEALAAGTPVIAADVPSLREIIRDRETGLLIPPGNKVALGRRTRELLRNPDLARRLAEAGRTQVDSRSPESTVARYAQLYSDVAA